MKTLLSAILLTACVGAFADKHGKMKEDWDKLPFDQARKLKLEKLDKKISMTTEARQCVNNAKDKDALKACMKEMKEDKHAMKEEMKAKLKQSQEEAED